ncbi:MAG TPA: hypothetical protein VK808_01845 [Bacteroidia bacterium]|jgi:hypothetical protein|nr:hypothetical protein [Bacteroidia bacterium]
MKQVTLNIPDNKFADFMKMIKSFSFVKAVEKKTPSVKKRTFTIIELNNKNYKFNREEL